MRYLALLPVLLIVACGESSEVDYARADELTRIGCEDLLHASGVEESKRHSFCKCIVEEIKHTISPEDYELNARYTIASNEGSSISERAALMQISPDDFVELGQRLTQIGVPAGQKCKALID